MSQESQGACEPVEIEEIDSARRRKVDGSQEAAENRYSIDQPCIYRLDPPGHEWIHRIECETHPASIANVAPQISHRPVNIFAVEKIIPDLGNEVMPHAHGHERKEAE